MPLPPNAQQHIEQQQGQAAAQFGKLQEMQGKLDKVRLGLGKLAGMGDAVSAEDVIREAGVLVGHGLSPNVLAGIMADMPENPQALAAWLKQQVEAITQKEMQVGDAMAKARGALGATSLALVAHHAEQLPPPPAPEPSAGLALGVPQSNAPLGAGDENAA